MFVVYSPIMVLKCLEHDTFSMKTAALGAHGHLAGEAVEASMTVKGRQADVL